MYMRILLVDLKLIFFLCRKIKYKTPRKILKCNEIRKFILDTIFILRRNTRNRTYQLNRIIDRIFISLSDYDRNMIRKFNCVYVHLSNDMDIINSQYNSTIFTFK